MKVETHRGNGKTLHIANYGDYCQVLKETLAGDKVIAEYRHYATALKRVKKELSN